MRRGSGKERHQPDDYGNTMESIGLNSPDSVGPTASYGAPLANPVAGGRGINSPREKGVYYDVIIPDTLDLAERARLGINHFTSIISEQDDYEMYWRADFDKSDQWAWPGYMWLQFAPLF